MRGNFHGIIVVLCRLLDGINTYFQTHFDLKQASMDTDGELDDDFADDGELQLYDENDDAFSMPGAKVPDLLEDLCLQQQQPPPHPSSDVTHTARRALVPKQRRATNDHHRHQPS